VAWRKLTPLPSCVTSRRTHSDSTPVGGEAAGEKEGGVEVKGEEEEEETGTLPSPLPAGCAVMNGGELSQG
jgi:hypothetical protein